MKLLIITGGVSRSPFLATIVATLPRREGSRLLSVSAEPANGTAIASRHTMSRIGWLLGGAAAAVALLLACEMQPDVGPGGSASADETTGRVVAITADTDPAQQLDVSHSGRTCSHCSPLDGPPDGTLRQVIPLVTMI